jgi:hypothetical protein
MRDRRIVIHENAVRGPFHVVELAAAHGPPEQGPDHEHQDHGQRDEQVEDIHGYTELMDGSVDERAGLFLILVDGLRRQSAGCAARIALRTTISELVAMPTAATSGSTKPNTAAGTAIRL